MELRPEIYAVRVKLRTNFFAQACRLARTAAAEERARTFVLPCGKRMSHHLQFVTVIIILEFRPGPSENVLTFVSVLSDSSSTCPLLLPELPSLTPPPPAASLPPSFLNPVFSV